MEKASLLAHAFNSSSGEADSLWLQASLVCLASSGLARATQGRGERESARAHQYLSCSFSSSTVDTVWASRCNAFPAMTHGTLKLKWNKLLSCLVTAVAKLTPLVLGIKPRDRKHTKHMHYHWVTPRHPRSWWLYFVKSFDFISKCF